jgi:transcriptional regulator with XRE-family HTH domain
VPIGSLRNWEQGIRLPRLDAAWRLAHALNVTLDDLTLEVFRTPKRPKRKGR